MTKYYWQGSVGEGWNDIVENAVTRIEALGGTILQVKEKFGGLRIYATAESNTEQIDDIINLAEIKASTRCEECGKPGKIDHNDSWLKTLCEEHSIARKNRK